MDAIAEHKRAGINPALSVYEAFGKDIIIARQNHGALRSLLEPLAPGAFSIASSAVFPGPEGKDNFAVPIASFFLKKKAVPEGIAGLAEVTSAGGEKKNAKKPHKKKS